MKRIVMLTLIVAGVLMINACQDEEINPTPGAPLTEDDGGRLVKDIQ